MTQDAESTQEQPVAASDVAVPDFDGRYVEVEALWESWMANAYAVTDAATGQRVFLKMLHESRKDDAQAYQLFSQEPSLLRLLARQVPSLPIVPVLETGRWQERPYFTQPLLTGWSLLRAMRRHPAFTGQAVLRVLESCLECLELLHGAGVTHGDISPDNIFIETDKPVSEDGTLPDDAVVRLLDFNSARRIEGPENHPDGLVFVKLRYVAPELCDRHSYSSQSDLYSLGVVLYELLVGELPFNLNSVHELHERRRAALPPIPLICEVPQPIEELVRQLLAIRPEDRPSSAAQCLRQLRVFKDIHYWLSRQSGPDISAYRLRPDATPGSDRAQNAEPLGPAHGGNFGRNAPTTKITSSSPVSTSLPLRRPPPRIGSPPASQSPVREESANLSSTAPAAQIPYSSRPSASASPNNGGALSPVFENSENQSAAHGLESAHRAEVSAIFDVRVPAQKQELDLAQFSVFAPASIPPASTFIFEVWAYLGPQREQMLERATRHGRLVERGSRGPVRVPSQTELTLVLWLDGFEVPEPMDTFFWCGEITNVPFIIKAPPDLRPGNHPGQVKILHDGLLLSKLVFEVCIGEAQEEQMPLSVRREQVTSAFASYATTDRDEVLRRVQGIRATGVNVFLDMISLYSGQDWQQQLLSNIRSSDIFYLFWSVAASKSEWVDREWRYALREKGIGYIHPIPLVDPRIVPPPAELASKHFNDLILACLRSQEATS